MDRDTRFIRNTTQSLIGVEEQPSLLSMIEGQIVIAQDRYTKKVSLSVKKKGKIHKVYLSSDGDQHVDKALITDELKYKRKFTDYRSFSHNFTDDLDGNEHFLPWWSNNEETSIRPDVGYLVPFNMTCHKLIFRPPDLDDNADNITFAIKKIDDGYNTTDSLCTYPYETTFVDHTSITINRGDWSADPTVEAGDVVAISITASHADIVTSAKGFYITSVWETEIII